MKREAGLYPVRSNEQLPEPPTSYYRFWRDGKWFANERDAMPHCEPDHWIPIGDHWVKSHKRGRDVADPLSWPVRVHRAQKPAKADPERQRSKVLFEALQAAKAGNLDDAVKLLTNAKFDRKDWPEFVLSKLEKV
jgi:hypothetical protein